LLYQTCKKGLQAFKNEQGAALVTALLVMLVLTLLGTVIAFTAATEGRQSVRYSDKTQAYYLARSGAEAASEYIIKYYDPENSLEDFVEGIDLENFIEEGTIEDISITATENEQTKILETTASYNDVRESVKVELVGRGGLGILDYAIFSKSEDVELDLGNNQTVEGPIGSKSTIDFGNNDEGDFEYDENLTDIIFPELDNSVFDNREDRERIHNEEITIDTDGEDKYLTIEGITSNRDIIVDGGGTLHLKVEDEFKFSGSGELITENESKVIIYVDNDIDEVILNGGPSLNAFIFAPGSKVKWAGGANETIKGGIIAKEFEGANSNTIVKHDPDLLRNGAFSNLDDLEEVSAGGAIAYERGLWR